jgi:predicted N-acyltransferase
MTDYGGSKMDKEEIEKLYRYYMINYDKLTVSKYALMQFIYELYEELKKR